VPGQFTANALRVLEARYLKRDREGRVIESPDEMFERVARAVSYGELLYGNASQARRWEARFHEMMSSLDFLPNSPCLMNAGTSLGQLSACFVLPVEDTVESIFGSLRDMALVQRTGGGTGFSFSRLRPAGDVLSSTGGQASGPVSFMNIFDCATEHIKQGGRRRGANMGVLRVDHPDGLEFIDAKRDPSALVNFNLSVGATDEFIRAVELGLDFNVRHPSDNRIVSHRPAREIFDAICKSAWETGDPGLIFVDTIERANPTPRLGRIESTNPCGEVPLLPNECCNLGSINLAHMVASKAGRAVVDWDKIGVAAADAIRFLDDVISINRYPTEAIEEAALATRKIGLGVMGFAEMCILLGMSYASEEAVRLMSDLMRFISTEALAASEILGDERGLYPAWPGSRHDAENKRLRNATVTSIAPAGTISIIADTSSGIEPLFALAYRHKTSIGAEPLSQLNSVLLRCLEGQGIDPQSVLRHVARDGSIGPDSGVPESLRRRFVTALEVPAEHHVRIQAAAQQHVDNAVSKTVNLPSESKPEDIARVYLLAYKLGCKGITVYRYGSRSEQVLDLGLDETPFEREYFARCDPGACRI
jgi:ribonucleoside-diphosphate reductase alpha chain